MTPEIVAEHEGEDGHLSVSRPRRGSGFQLVFDGPAGVETVIRFDELEISRVNVQFYRRVGRPRFQTGSIEPDLTAWGDVGKWLRDHAAQAPEVEA